MTENEHPRILIFGQPFNNFSGGGITLTNLFKGWPKDSIAVIFIPYVIEIFSTDVCNKYYHIGREEHTWKFPFNLIKKPFSPISQIREIRGENANNSVKTGIKHFLVSRYLNPFLEWLGLFHGISNITISQKLKEWLIEFHPDILYLQVSDLESIRFAKELVGFLNIPVAVHMMDDWPSTISNKGPFRSYWKRQIITEFVQLLERADLHLSICEAMSEEYKARYGKTFIAFHNTIDLKLWLPYRNTEFNKNRKEINVLFSGRIGAGIYNSIIEVASAIEILWEKNRKIKLHIQTPNKGQDILTQIQKFNCVVINPPTDYSLMPGIYAKADILVIANDFSEDAIKFLKYSMPTKVPEYMISGTPILIYAPAETAVSKFFANNNCGYCVTSNDTQEIVNAIDLLIKSPELRRRISNNAVNLAKEYFDGEKVRNKFQNLLIALPKRKSLFNNSKIN